MKKMRRFAAIAAAAAMTACMAMPMTSVFAATQETDGLTITFNAQDSTDHGTHKFAAYQIFSGEMSDGVLVEIDWGDAIADPDALVAALKASTVFGEGAENKFYNCTDAESVAKVLGSTDAGKNAVFGDNSAYAKEVARIIGSVITADSTTSGEFTAATETTAATISKLPAGYYLIQDAADSLGQVGEDNSGAKTRYILKLTSANAEVEIKSAAPKVDKLVLDEEADAEEGATDGWGESADHAMNETFQFKLVAEVPAKSEMGSYKAYTLKFTDTMSTGVTFDSIASVTVNGIDVPDTGNNAYVCTAEEGMVGDGTTEWSLTIADLLKYESDLAENGATVEVVYNAHLNEAAYVNTADGATTNKNTVKLQYSNNPNWDGTGTSDLGETPEDSVWVFTYQITNTKIDGSNGGAALGGVTFNLLDANDSPISLVYDATLCNGAGGYRLPNADDAAEDISAVITSADNTGAFNIVGLDTGDYTLTEVDPLPGYNRCDDVEITIAATHAEDTATGTSATVDLQTESENLVNTIENNQGSVLPSTGGIGTTLFYVVGGTLAAGAGVALIAKKRMKNED